MEERPHRTLSAAEVGVADAARPHQGRHPAIPPTPPRWLVSFVRLRHIYKLFKAPRALLTIYVT